MLRQIFHCKQKHLPCPIRSASPAVYTGCYFKIICAETSLTKFFDGRLGAKEASAVVHEDTNHGAVVVIIVESGSWGQKMVVAIIIKSGAS